MSKMRGCLCFLTVVLIGLTSAPELIAQTVTITAPEERALIQHLNGTAEVSSSADASGVPSGGGVEFVLDLGTAGVRSVKDFTAPYTAVFSLVPLGEHTVDAYVIDSSGARLPAHDRHERVGVGELIVTLGDSITAGEADDITYDNWSADGRNGPYVDPLGNAFGGFQPILNDLLTAARGCPHSVINEGLPGEKSSEANSRVGSVIDQYPTAKTWLVAYGTNDTNSEVSPESFKANLQSIVNQIQTAIPGAIVYLPKCFYFDESDSDAYRIPLYHDRVGDLIRNTPNSRWGADQYTLFKNNHALYDHTVDETGTWLDPYPVHHPNGIGVQKLAMLWEMAIIDRAILVTDGVTSGVGGSWADKIHIEGANTIGLSESNLLRVCEQADIVPPPPPGTQFASSPWNVRTKLTGAGGFAGGTATASIMIEDDVLPPDASRWEQAWMALDDELVPTSREPYPGRPNYYLLTADTDRPGQIVCVLDVTPPVTSCAPTPSQPDGSNGWYVTVPEVALNGSDGTGLPVANTRYRWGSGSEHTYTGSFSAPIGTNTLYYYSTDQSANVESVKSATFQVDRTPPTTPIVTDPGAYIPAGVPISISWSSQDSESGIQSYDYAVGTSPGGTDLQEWTSTADGSTSWTPVCPEGTVCYFSVRSFNEAGAVSATGSSDGITISSEVSSIGLAKLLPDGAPVVLRHVVVSAQFGNSMYVQEKDRSAGIRVFCSEPAAPGSQVTVAGRMHVDPFNRCITEGSVSDIVPCPLPRPCGLWLSGFGTNRPWSAGLATNGLLMKTWGHVDGSYNGWGELSDGAGGAFLMVDTVYSGDVASTGSWVSVTGISELVNDAGTVFSVLIPRSAQDIVVIEPPPDQ